MFRDGTHLLDRIGLVLVAGKGSYSYPSPPLVFGKTVGQNRQCVRKKACEALLTMKPKARKHLKVATDVGLAGAVVLI